MVTWGAIGARTTESQVHRQLASGLSMPVGFKNGTGGDVQIAIDAIRAAAHPHSFFGVTEQGLAAIVATRGNHDCHVILRGGRERPELRRGQRPAGARHAAATSGCRARLMIDASHGNSEQGLPPPAASSSQAIAEQIAAGERGIVGVMIESFLVEGRQELGDRSQLTYGQSITDACIGWDTTESALEELAVAVRARRQRGRAVGSVDET